MIKRTYFISAQCFKNDGSGSYSHFYASGYSKSWKSNYSKIFENMLDIAKDNFLAKGLDANNMQIIAFNRI
jgi:hypothetical protein